MAEALNLTRQEILARRAWAEDQFLGREIVPRTNWAESELKESVAWTEPSIRKCICCGAPGYEVDH